MRFQQTIDENRRILRRIAALLSAFACLAERAAGRSRAVCFLVLLLLRPGEAIARDYLDSLAPGAAWHPAPEPLRPTAGAAEALRLAESFRWLAAAFAVLADDGLAAWQAAPAKPTSGRRVATPALRPAGPAVGRLDSS